MVNLNMIDIIGSGIKKMFTIQRFRNFPMPDFDLSDPNKVKVRVTGKVIDLNYTQMLINKTDLDLKTVIALDKIQKHKFLADSDIKRLKSRKLIEGRKPNYYVTASVAAVTGKKHQYIKNRAFDTAHYKEMVISFIKEYGSAGRDDIDKLLMDKLSDIIPHLISQQRCKLDAN